jgi:DNA-binding XRE family transcriptional regulator
MKLKDQLKYVRRKLRLTQDQLAQKTGISKATIVRWESSNIEPQMISYGKFVDFCEKNGIKFED